MFTAPTFYRQMAALAGKYDLSSLKKSVSAGEALPDATRQLWKQASGLEMIDGIGGTEMIHVFVSSPPDEVRRGAIGRVVPGYIAQIVDDDMNPLPNGTAGRLAIKGPTGCRYLADERQRRFVQAGWNLPGDTFVQDDDGYLFYQARNDDMIVSAGCNIAGPEVEDALLRHPAVAECGVVGAPCDERGQVVKAFVVLKPGFEPGDALVAELQAFVKANIAPYKYPRPSNSWMRCRAPRPASCSASRCARWPERRQGKQEPTWEIRSSARWRCGSAIAIRPASCSIRAISR